MPDGIYSEKEYVAKKKSKDNCHWCGEPVLKGEPVKSWVFYDPENDRRGYVVVHKECDAVIDDGNDGRFTPYIHKRGIPDE